LMRGVGRSEMKPTVSDRMAPRPEGSATWRSVGSSVSNSLRAAFYPCNRHKCSCLAAMLPHPCMQARTHAGPLS
jgi:hypothetical protein